MLGKTESELLEKEKDSHRRWLKDATYRQIESRFAMNDSAAAYAASQPNTNAALVFTDLGICPYGLLGCDIGGEIIKDNKNPNKRLYGNVPGFPEKNCVRCRFLLTSYAFLPGLVRRKKRSLELIHQICLEQYERGSKDFSIAMIGRLS
ncbi:MAG: gamma-mobile-trio protein GmtX, partial [Nitrospinales bacterium]